jgi:hypothetical protein
MLLKEKLDIRRYLAIVRWPLEIDMEEVRQLVAHKCAFTALPRTDDHYDWEGFQEKGKFCLQIPLNIIHTLQITL